jgi:hypothetical protein
MADFATQAQQIRNIWAGDWQARLSSYSKTLPQTFTAAEEKEFYRLGGVGQGVYKSYVNPSALPNEYIPAGKLYAQRCDKAVRGCEFYDLFGECHIL